MQSIMLNENQLNQLAFNYDPSPILGELQHGSMQADPGGLWPGMPMGTAQAANPWTSMVQPTLSPEGAASMSEGAASMSGGAGGATMGAPLGLAMGALGGGVGGGSKSPPMPQAPAVMPKNPVSAKINIPDISQLLHVNLGPKTQVQQSLAQLLGAK